MKVKYLLGSLLGGALLAACTAEDNFNDLAASKEVQNSSPVFTVHFEGENGTRADMNGTNGRITFKDGDLMTLYHGVGVTGNVPGWTVANSTTPLTLTNGFTKYENAIYEGASAGEDGGFDFKTKAMVKTGAAIMVYPADLHFKNTGSGELEFDFEGSYVDGVQHYITEQNAETRKKTPYISEVLYIEPHNNTIGDAKGAERTDAGYGRKYDVYLKGIAATLKLTPKPTHDPGIEALYDDEKITEPLEFKKIKLATTTAASENVFTTKISVSASNEPSNGSQMYTSRISGGTTIYDPAHPAWKNRTDVKSEQTTKAIEYTLNKSDNNVAVFTLLPLHSNVPSLGTMVDKDGKTADELEVTESTIGNKEIAKYGLKYIDEGSVKAYSDAVVTVKTNYGKVRVNNGKGKTWYREGDEANAERVGNGLAFFLMNMFNKVDDMNGQNKLNGIGNNGWNGNTAKAFHDEPVGAFGARYINVDMRDLDMNCLHIENEQNLINAVEVLKLIYPNGVGSKNVTFILDGVKARNTDAANQIFEIKSVAGRTAYKTALDKGVKFALCATTGEICKTVVLNNVATTAEEVPFRLEFTNTASGDEDDVVSIQPFANVRLVGNWKMTESKHYLNVKELEVADRGTLDLGETAGARVDLGATNSDNYNKKTELVNSSAGTPELVNNGRMNVKSRVFLMLNTANYGKLYIGDDKNRGEKYALSMKGYASNDGIVLANMIKWTPGKNENDYDYENDKNFVTRGEIYNYGQLSNTLEGVGSINNYGKIFMMDEGAVTLITSNGITPQTTSKNTNMSANLIIKEGTNKYTLGSGSNVAGIIELLGKGNKLTSVDASQLQGFIQQKIDGKEVNESSVSEWANYIVLEDGVETVGDLGERDANINFIEIQSKNVEITKTLGDKTAFVVRDGASVNILREVELKFEVSYFKGDVYLGGELTPGEYGKNKGKNKQTYFGGVEKDRDMVHVVNGKLIE